MALKTFILSEEMRSSKSGFFIEGTDIEMDYPDQYPLPMETEVLENEVPIALRLLPNCPYLEKELQIKNGYPEKYKYTDNDRKKLTFVHARLILDDKKDKIYLQYIERAAWKKGNEDKKARQATRTIYMEYDENILISAELDAEEMVTYAKQKVFQLSEPEVKDLYRLSVGGNFVPSSMTIKQMRRHLLSIAESNPEFITEGIKSTGDKIALLINKGVELGIVSLQIPGQVNYLNPVTNDWVKIVDLSDAQGSEAKFNKFVDYLMTDMGAAELSIIENRINELESADEEQVQQEELYEDDKAKPRRTKK